MKEIKAFVRTEMAGEVVHALEVAGFRSLTVIDVSALGDLADPKSLKYSLELVDKYSKVAKIELACRDADADRVVRVIRQNGCTHERGDGIIFVSPVARAVKIRTGEEGEEILQK